MGSSINWAAALPAVSAACRRCGPLVLPGGAGYCFANPPHLGPSSPQPPVGGGSGGAVAPHPLGGSRGEFKGLQSPRAGTGS
eukprot:7657276-Alexandrium_andersonii.AAC.1